MFYDGINYLYSYLKSYFFRNSFISYPFKLILSSTNLKMELGNAQVHLCIANHGKSLLGSYQMTVVLHSNVFKRKLLLIHGCRSKQGCFNSLLEPRGSDVAGIADLLNGFDLMAYSLCFTIADGNVTGNLLAFFKHIGSWHL